MQAKMRTFFHVKYQNKPSVSKFPLMLYLSSLGQPTVYPAPLPPTRHGYIASDNADACVH